MIRLPLRNLSASPGAPVTEENRYSKVTLGPKDAIFGLSEDFKLDTDPKKVLLAEGAYRDENGKSWILPVVAQAEKAIIEEQADMNYAPIIGSRPFLKLATKLCYGPEMDIVEGKLASIQTISGTGALRVAFEFLSKFLDNGNGLKLLLPMPTYANHGPVLKHAGNYLCEQYRYFDKKSNGLDFDGMIADIESATDGSLIMLHGVAHNPTGVDPDHDQWVKISEVCKRKKMIVIFDFAYQGFASGDADRDAFSVRQFVRDGHKPLVCQSFAKNFGLYGHRAGLLSVACQDSEEVGRVESQLKILARASYSNPPIHGSRVVEKILSDPKLYDQWKIEMKSMADRIKSMRETLKRELLAQGSTRNWDHLTNQIGMFCYSGLDEQQCAKLMKEWHVYMTKNGRIALTGVNDGNVKYIAEAIHAVSQ